MPNVLKFIYYNTVFHGFKPAILIIKPEIPPQTLPMTLKIAVSYSATP
jgi:hypothetical protein